MIDASQRILAVNSQVQGEELGEMSPPLKRQFELEIKTLENAPRHPDKFPRLMNQYMNQKC
jgi:hypothetical protein